MTNTKLFSTRRVASAFGRRHALAQHAMGGDASRKDANMLLQRDEVERLLDEHRKAYETLRWAESRAERGEVGFDELHDAWGSRDAALAWLRAALDVPAKSRARDGEESEIAALIASMLRTSFWFSPAARGGTCACVLCDAPRPAKRRDSDRLPVRPMESTRLAPRLLTRHDDEVAATLTKRCLEALAESIGVAPAFPVEMTRSDARQALEMVTYAWQLRRRVECQSQGKGLVVLWRRVRWGLSAGSVMDAQARLAAILHEHDMRAKSGRRKS